MANAAGHRKRNEQVQGDKKQKTESQKPGKIHQKKEDTRQCNKVTIQKEGE